MRKIILFLVVILLSACSDVKNLGVNPYEGQCPSGYVIKGFTVAETGDKAFALNNDISNQKVLTACFQSIEQAISSGYRDVTLYNPNPRQPM